MKREWAVDGLSVISFFLRKVLFFSVELSSFYLQLQKISKVDEE